ncbi:RNA-binding protein 28 [Anopheles cruzii]|uniref:RNA-binding protein 28 n=1 Tax=Anopheles cruzii TaxID=68878 RepID=UPI0022EC2CFD|nr:RNA-binding protein 28 [Anopheles cruzii]
MFLDRSAQRTKQRVSCSLVLKLGFGIEIRNIPVTLAVCRANMRSKGGAARKRKREKATENNGTQQAEEEPTGEGQASGNYTKTGLRKRSRVFNHRQHRIIVRNVSYKLTEQKLRSEFERFGELEEANILKRPDGRLVGCAFLQFCRKEESERAVREMDGEVFMGRKLEVRYALDKTTFERGKHTKAIKPEEVKEETGSDGDGDVQVKEESSGDDEEDSEDEDDGHAEEEEGEAEESSDTEQEDEKPELPLKGAVKREKKSHSELEEGRTVFVKNLPFDVTAEELKDVMAQFGIVEQVLINKEPISGHSKGSAFVIFKLKDSAQMSCRQSFKLQVHDQFIEILEALRKKDVSEREKARLGRQAKDSRNLYLLKEGLIMAGSPAAKDVSKPDMAQRLRLEQRNNEMLKNYNRFVSRERLTVHNIPEQFTSDDLRNMVLKLTAHKPSECRVMRDTRPSFGNPTGRSRGYGFLAFKRHEAALEVLRKLNNNPTVFGRNHRPIVSFSIEDRNVHNIKQKRLEKSRANNPTYQKKMEELRQKKQRKLLTKKESKRLAMEKLAVAPSAVLQKLNNPKAAAPSDVPAGPRKKERKRDAEKMVTAFTGELSKKGKAGIRSNRKLLSQADAHMQRLKEERKEQKKKRLRQEHDRNRKLKASRKVTQKVNLVELQKEDRYFKETVGKYKNLINQATTREARGKWYGE